MFNINSSKKVKTWGGGEYKRADEVTLFSEIYCLNSLKDDSANYMRLLRTRAYL
jgi:hypothetical protein